MKNKVPTWAWVALAIVSLLPFAPTLIQKVNEAKTAETKTSAPTIPTRILKCDSGTDTSYPWIGYGVSTLVVPPSNCWTEWQGVGSESGGFSQKLKLTRNGQVWRRYLYGDGKVGPPVEPKPFEDRDVGYPTAVQFRNDGKEEVRIEAVIR